MEPIERPSPLQHLWLRNFPFSYWDNRIEKISQYNSEDQLEALYVMLQLVDLYTHVFTARIRNPDEPWFMIKEQTYTRQIGSALDKLTETTDEGDNLVFVDKLAEEPEGLIEFEHIEPEWDVEIREWIAVDFLGCPVSFDTENKEILFGESPDYHIGGANAILNFWRENRELLNDFKHGFRVLPCDSSTFEYLAENGFVAKNDDLDKILEEVDNEEWSVAFIRMSTNEKDDHFEVGLDIHRADVSKCLSFSRLALRQLHNLFGRGGEFKIGSYLGEIFNEPDTDTVSIVEYIGNIELVMFKPEFNDEE